MNRIHSFLVVMCFVAVSAIVCCTKKATTTNPSANLNQLFAGLRSTPQNFSVTAGTAQTVVGASGTVLHFYPNSFKDINGNLVTNGAINIQLTEMYKPGDMIQNRATATTTDGSLLQSGGEVNIVATWNGLALTANKYGIGFLQSGYSGLPMQWFQGSGNKDSATVWTITDSSRNAIVQGTGKDSLSSNENQYYLFDSCTSFNWINCDRFFDSTNKTVVNVVMPDNSYNQSNTQVFLVFPDINSVSELSGTDNLYNSATATFTLNHGLAPIGMNFKLVAITNKSGNYSYYETGGVITSNLTVTAAMAAQTEAGVVALLGGL